jgi:hypothetical protein
VVEEETDSPKPDGEDDDAPASEDREGAFEIFRRGKAVDERPDQIEDDDAGDGQTHGQT